ncbi:FG-GAP-like repeat-containing protein [Streptomyces sp. NBC_00124]|uniref:FG-GAP-like repeat-containing protein n=1 Tax=Streptomyces sp. NBC_00124 TaxID=2975662 RepID=UPI00224FB2EF|nr:FG-GAP-like repeat-containing protein [Streptomyces sp. NBC_00124]MCX5361311.1 FG-GAP-like repeat-containing protein [Streptomyces sp. NBC_00124]
MSSYSRPPRPVTRAFALLAAGAAVAAGALLPVPAAHAVVGTPTPDGGHAFSAHLVIGEGAGARACSGALVDAEWLVTAASCFAADPQSGTAPAAGKPALKAVATVGRTDLNTGTGGHVAEITRIVPRAGRDLVFARLASPATGITPVKLATTAPAAGDALTVLGYGRTKTEWAPGKLHQANYTLDSVAAHTLAMTGRTADDSVCKGDTGGPVLRSTTGGSYELVAVNSRSWQGGCYDSNETRTGAVAARTDGSPTGTGLLAGQTLRSGDVLLSKSAKVTMGTDGNLTVDSNAGKTLWASKTSGNAGATATLGTDGNLAVKSAAGATLWQSKTSAPGGRLVLQDHGNLVVRNAPGASLWSSNTVVRNDLSGDGRADFAVWYDFGDGRDAVNTFLTAPDGAFQAPRNGWIAPAGNWTAANAQTTTGDYNGDGLADVAALYGYSDGTMGMWTWLAKGNGTYATPFVSWRSAPGNWTAARSHPVSGDFNGDGRDDIATWYDYAGGDDRLFTFLSDEKGGFTNPVGSFYRETGWTYANMNLGAGDYNGDGRDDLGVFYNYGDGSARTFTFLTTAAGGFSSPVGGWEGPTWGEGARTDVQSGDFDGDGRDDLVAWYDHTDGSDGVHTFLAGADGAFSTHKASPRIASGITRASMKPAVGDFDGDGRDDIGFLYGYGNGTVRMWTMLAKADGTFGAYTGSWASTDTSWTFANAQAIERYPQK